MFAQLRSSLILSSLLLVVASGAWAQTTTIEGDVKDANGAPLKGAVIVLDRTDIKGHYTVKSDKKGHWLYTGLPYGKFDITCQVDGQTVDSVKGVQSKYGDSTTIDFDMRKAQAAKAGLAQAAATGELPAEAARGMSKEEKEKFEATAKKNAETMKKNKALNDAFNGGQDAKKAGDAEPDKAQKIVKYQAAIDSYNKAGELDPSQAAVWDALGETYSAPWAMRRLATRGRNPTTRQLKITIRAWRRSQTMRAYTTKLATCTVRNARFRKLPMR